VLVDDQGLEVVRASNRHLADALQIGHQARPRLFDRRIVLPEQLYERVIEARERLTAQGEVLTPLDLEAARKALEVAYGAGIRSAAIVLLHAYRYPEHERQLADLARATGRADAAATVAANLVARVARAAIAVTATTWSASVAWRMPSTSPRPMSANGFM
jgi:5-oxoprolinase (ATP-hydrolysing)